MASMCSWERPIGFKPIMSDLIDEQPLVNKSNKRQSVDLDVYRLPLLL